LDYKRELYLELRTEKLSLRTYYNKYCHILSKVIKMAKKMEYDKRILTSTNKVRTAWMIVNSETGRNANRKRGIQSLNVDGNNTENQQIIADALNEHFITIAEKINTSRHEKHKHININDIDTDTFTNFMNQA
jgi:hypothetical protein